MSVPIQTTSLNELAGGERELTPQPERRGNEFPQNFPLSGRQGVQVDNDVQAATVSPNNANGAASRDKGDISGMNAGGGRGINVKLVDDKVIAGSGGAGSDFRKSGDTAKDSLGRAANGQGGPRGPAGQFPNGKRDATLGSFSKDHAQSSFRGDTADSDAGN
ncbi:MAG: hypothetical protein ACLPH5_04595 [Candidatus Sulfotelmatobacter sp.]